MKTKYFLFAVLLITFISCKENEPTADCPSDVNIENIQQRNFKMGFSTWSFGDDVQDVQDTYAFIMNNADIYSEQFDGFIPWSAWINDTALPTKFTEDVNYRVSKITAGKDILLSVSLLNIARDNLNADVDGSLPTFTAMNDSVIEAAYIKHLNYLIGKFNPKYLVMGMEVNEMLVKSSSKWSEYKLLMANVRQKIKQQHPTLLLSESITLHNYYDPNVPNKSAFITEITNYVNQLDFAAISFYPYIRYYKNYSEYQPAFNFLHAKINVPIAFSETSYIAENLSVAAFNYNLASDECMQNEYLRTLCRNAQDENYLFFIWWCHRDYDELYEIFPADMKDLGKLWKDTGILDETGKSRKSHQTWTNMLSK